MTTDELLEDTELRDVLESTRRLMESEGDDVEAILLRASGVIDSWRSLPASRLLELAADFSEGME